uniref:ELMO domain-containing protein n=1 Tax=Timema cristinae TaxID=61476 RepID=A0A7R9CCD7_TIMCR|nr:unnamed protein product [Timema cristinae]
MGEFSTGLDWPMAEISTGLDWSVAEFSTGLDWSVAEFSTGLDWSVAEFSTGLDWSVAEFSTGLDWSVAEFSTGLDWSVAEFSTGLDWSVAEFSTGLDWSVAEFSTGLDWSVAEFSTGLDWSVAEFSTGLDWSVAEFSTGLDWSVAEFSTGLDWSVAEFSTGLDWSVAEFSTGLDWSVAEFSTGLDWSVAEFSTGLDWSVAEFSTGLDWSVAEFSTGLDWSVAEFSTGLDWSVAEFSTGLDWSVAEFSTGLDWSVAEFSTGLDWSVAEFSTGLDWPMAEFSTGLDWFVAEFSTGLDWPMAEFSTGLDWLVAEFSTGLDWSMAEFSTGLDWSVAEFSTGLDWLVAEFSTGLDWPMAEFSTGLDWLVAEFSTGLDWSVVEFSTGLDLSMAETQGLFCIHRKKYSRESALNRNRKNVETDDISGVNPTEEQGLRTRIRSLLTGRTKQTRIQERAYQDWHRGSNDPNYTSVLASARQEWDSVATVEPTFKESVDPRRSTPHISVHQTLLYFQGLDLSQEMSNGKVSAWSIQPVKRVPGALRSLCELLKHVTSVHHSKDGACKHLLSYSGRLVLCCMFQSNTRTSVERRGLCTLFSCLLGPPNLHEQLLAERDLVFAIAQCKLDLEDCVHYRMLQTVYQRLTGTRLDCTCYGSHWQQIGFQGNDPGTDLRGVGMFGLLQLLYLASSPHLMPLARDIYRVSLDEQQNFPLAVLSLNMTRMALQTLRQGLLNRECNERQMVVEVLNEFYAAIFCHTLHLWTSQHKTIRDSGYVLKVPHLTTHSGYTLKY